MLRVRAAPRSQLAGQLVWGLLAIALLAGVSVLSRRLDAFHRAEGSARYPVPRAADVEAVATGYDDVLADGFWLQFLQYDGAKLTEDLQTRRWPNVQAGLSLVTGLDPHFTEAYLFGSWVLGDADLPHQAERLLAAGVARDRRWPPLAPPPTARYDFQLGFIRFLYLHDYRSAGAAFHQAAWLASRPPCRDPELAVAATRMAAGMAERGHEQGLAIGVWEALYRQAEQAKDLHMLAIARRALARLARAGAPRGH